MYKRQLQEEVTQRRFREDLYYRLAVIRIELPPLRARPDDVALLVDHFAEGRATRGPAIPLSPATRASLLSRAWPGNVRELRNAVARAMSLGVAADPRPAASTESGIDIGVPFMAAREAANEAFERAYLTEALRVTGGNATKAAELAGLNRKFVQRAIKRYGLRGD